MKLSLFLITFSFLSTNCIAQEYEWKFFYDVELLSRNIETIAIDSSGCLWFARGGPGYGIVKYDGESCINYNTINSGLPTNDILCIYIDTQNDIKWIGTEQDGLVRYDGLNWTVYNIDNSDIPSNIIGSIAMDKSGSIWVGTGNGTPISSYYGYAKFDGFQWTVWNENNSELPKYEIRSIAFENENTVWFAQGSSGAPAYYGCISQWENNNVTVYFVGESMQADTYCRSIVIDKNNNKWIATHNKGLVKIDKEDSITVYNTDNSSIPADYKLNAIILDDYDNKWITYEYGIIKFSEDSLFVYTHNDFFWPNNSLECMVIDDKDNIWLGTSKGLVKFNENIAPTDLEFKIGISTNTFYLNHNFPNPFNPTTTINYSIPKQSNVTLKVFDVLGSEVETLVNKEKPQGNYEIEFDGSDLTIGIYLYRLQAGDFVETKKMILLK